MKWALDYSKSKALLLLPLADVLWSHLRGPPLLYVISKNVAARFEGKLKFYNVAYSMYNVDCLGSPCDDLVYQTHSCHSPRMALITIEHSALFHNTTL